MKQQTKYSVIQIIDTLDAGGAERVLVTVSNILAANGHTVTVATTLHKGILANELNSSITLVELRRPSKWHLGTMKKMVMLCNKFDVVHVHSSHNLRYLYLAAKLFGLKKQIFFHEHFGNIDIDKRVHWHQKIIYPNTVLVAVSKSIQLWAIKSLKMNAQNVHLLENIILKQNASFTKETDSSVKQLLLVSNFRRAKNIEFAVELITYLVKKIPIHLTIIGQAVDKEYVAEIISLIEDNNLSNNITINHQCHNIQATLHNFDLAIHTAKTESGPLVLIEYMAQQLPFLSYNTGEVVQQIKNELSNSVVNHFNIEEWVERAYQLLTDTSLQNQHKQMAETLFYKHYSAHAYYQKLLAIYHKHIH